jgi:hypothetical protein
MIAKHHLNSSRFFLAVVVLLVIGPHAVCGQTVRIATFNIKELSWDKLQQVDSTGRGTNAQLRAAAEVIQRVKPDILLINEIDYTGPVDEDGVPADKNAASAFHDRYLAVGQSDLDPLDFEFVFYRATNTGVPSHLDFNNNGQTTDPNDAYGFGRYPGEYGQALFSRFPLDEAAARTFRKLLWKDVPGNLMPDGSNGKPAYYSAEAVTVFRLSSKTHWDVPIKIPGHTIHLLCSHPTPPVFDGPEDANGRRNSDEIRLWRDYITAGEQANWIRDDSGRSGGLGKDASFVILGDLNADPVRGDMVNGIRPIEMLLGHSRVFDPKPQSRGTAKKPLPEQFAALGPYRTSEFGRLDYVLPSRDLRMVATGIFWPTDGEPGHAAVAEASDHRLVWIDIAKP